MNSWKRAVAVAIAGTSLVFSPASVRAQDVPPPPDAPSTAPAPEPTPAPLDAGAPPATAVSPSATPAPAPATAVAVKPQPGPAPMGAPGEGVRPILPEGPEWLRGVTLGAAALLWYYQPIVPRSPGVENNVSVFWAHLLVDGKWGPFGLHIEPRFRDTPLRTASTNANGVNVITYTQDDRAYLQEAYAFADIDVLHSQLKLGKEYSHFGYFWDNSFYGNVQVYDGLKLDPDYGASFEGDAGKGDDLLGIGWWAQYFVVDGTTNVSLVGRDTISVPGARRRNQTVVRLEPRLNVGGVKIAVGVSGEYLQADIPSIGPQDVWRSAVDATVTFAGLKMLGELQHQSGRHVTDFPFPSTPAGPGSSKNIDYAQIGGEYTLGPVTARYYVSLGSYRDAPMPGGGKATVKQWLHVPALAFAVSPNISLLAELALWQNDTPTASTLYDRSFNLTLFAHL